MNLPENLPENLPAYLLDKLIVTADAGAIGFCLLAASILAVSTWWTARRCGLSHALLALIVLDIFVGVVELPSRLSQRVMVIGNESLIVRCGRWYNPIEIHLPLADVEVVYEVERSRHWLERDTFWLFQNANFERKRLHLPPLFYRQRGAIASYFMAQGIAVIVHEPVKLSERKRAIEAPA